MIIEKTVLIDKWLLINADDKSLWQYLFFIDGKLRSFSEAEELYNQFKNQPERLNPEGTIFEEKSEYGSKGKFGLLNSACDSPTSENK